MKVKTGAMYWISGTSLTPKATANMIQLKHNPNAEVCKSNSLDLCLIKTAKFNCLAVYAAMRSVELKINYN